jgi:hypothetical protein
MPDTADTDRVTAGRVGYVYGVVRPTRQFEEGRHSVGRHEADMLL